MEKRAHGGLHRSEEALAIAQRTLEEKIAEYLADAEAYKARILHLETLLAGFGIRPDGSSSTAPPIKAEDVDRAPLMVHVFVQAERDVVLEQATTANLNAFELSTTNAYAAVEQVTTTNLNALELSTSHAFLLTFFIQSCCAQSSNNMSRQCTPQSWTNL